MLDLGTGSGILAIAAAKLGAKHVLAVDNDPVAVKTARGNVITNGVQKVVDVVPGSLSSVSKRYDLVVVNILARVIVDMVQEGLATQVRSRGWLIAAGIITDQEPEVAAALVQERFVITERQYTDDWVCLVARPDYLSD